MKIGIDIDNVICNTTETVLDYINERLPDVNLRMEDITEYWMERSLPPKYAWIIKTAFDSKEMWKEVKLIDGAAQCISRLIADGHKVYFVTSTTSNNFRKKIKFLQRSIPMPPGYAEIHTISIKTKQLLQLDILIDDCLDNLLGDKTYFSVCLDYPWNRDITDKYEKGFIRVEDWDAIDSLFERGYFKRFGKVI